MPTATGSVHVSVVSTGQGRLAQTLLRNLEACPPGLIDRVTLTLNTAERLPFAASDLALPLSIHENAARRGFGANHNAAFRRYTGGAPYFCALNPDLRMGPDVLGSLVERLQHDPRIGVAAPLARGSDGQVQDSARRLPTPRLIVAKALRRARPPDYPPGEGLLSPDWVAGLFMLFPARVFSDLGGFDERYFLYYEDVDFCCRARLAGYDVVVDRSVAVLHDGSWTSHRNPRYLRWHLASMARFFGSRVYRRAARQARSRRTEASSVAVAAEPAATRHGRDVSLGP